MKEIVLLVFSVLFFQCTCSHSNITDDEESKSAIFEVNQCVKEGGEEFSFFYDGFSSEGADGKILFKNDTLINRITFSYATSMVYVKQEYWFRHNKLFKYKQINNYIKPDKSGYIEKDSVVVEGKHIFKSESFSDTLYQNLLLTVSDKNPCWKNKFSPQK